MAFVARAAFASSSFAIVLAACTASTSSEPKPGGTSPGGACSQPTDCGCWQCNCQGIPGEPGAAQLCVSGKCPTGAEACAPICQLANTTVASAVSVDSCDGRP